MTVEISTDPGRLDVEMIYRYLSEESYWAKNIPRDTVERSLANALCFGAYGGSDQRAAGQVGFARVVTDFATFAYVADVFVLASHRGQGISKALMAAVRQHPRLQGLRRWHLVTRDAQALYGQFGFRELQFPERHMESVVSGYSGLSS